MQVVGQTEELLMIIIGRIPKDQASGVPIQRAYEELTNKRISPGALYTTLHRLVDKGFLESREVAGGEARRNIPKTVYEVTGHGAKALEEAEMLRLQARRIGGETPALGLVGGVGP